MTCSDEDFTAQTASETVMAEQASHNVVNDFESAGASALVDVAANQTDAAFADHGSPGHVQQPQVADTKPDAVQTSLTANHDATLANTQNSSTTLAAPNEPPHTENSTIGTVEAASAKEIPAEGQSINGADEVAISGDVLADDASMPEGSVDISLNSDTEGSRGDASELKKDEKNHVRTNSVKKPLTFSKVSLTKNFLAKSATATPPAARPGDKPSPVGTPAQASAAKPRLIAKVGTSLRDVQKTRLNPEAAGGPDASKVWNKNRRLSPSSNLEIDFETDLLLAVQPPPPRQFTDEELKQQYGIHLATRLQTDEDGKQSKWADIDDDEEDWAPEAVEWMDGTKSTLISTETPVPLQKDQKTAIAASPAPTQVKPNEGIKPTLIMRKPTELGPSKTVLKPGAVVAAAQAKQGELGSGGPSDKTLDGTKAPATLPAKSPWAVLPPVEKVSPVNPPVQQKQTMSFATQDARAYQSLPPPQTAPTREIAADTFDRSWHEGEGGARELFNSANGRYEPVPEGRRGSVKHDSTHRKPALLQRSSQTAGPAEPSAAFQTRSSVQPDGSRTRRRSSVSRGSLPPVRRMSTSRTSDASPAPERRGSTTVGHDLRASPKTARTEPVPPNFSHQNAWEQQMPPRPEASPEEDPVKVQERIMREKREVAKKRREEEALEEAEKKERLKAKLASLEGAGKSRKEREAEAAATAAAAAAEAAVPSKSPENTATEVPKAEDIATAPREAHKLEAQAMPTTPLPETQKLAIADEALPSPIPPNHATVTLPERPVSSTDNAQRHLTRSQLSPRASARAPFQQPAAQFKAQTSAYSQGAGKQQPSLANSGAFSSWPSNPRSGGNVWGGLSGLGGGIGNGTFDFGPMMNQQNSLPPPPGMSRAAGSQRISPQSLGSESRSPSLQQSSIAEPSRGFGPPGLEPRPDAFANQARVNGASPAPGLSRQTHAPGPIAPPSRAQQQSQPQQSPRHAALAAWNHAAQTLPYQYNSDVQAAERKRAEGSSIAPREDTFRETFKQTTADSSRLGAPRRYEKAEYTIHDATGSRSVQSLSPAPPISQTQPPGPYSNALPLSQDPWRGSTENNVRMPDGSLHMAHGGVDAPLPPVGARPSQQSSTAAHQISTNHPTSPLPPGSGANEPSPPPPETSTHPVHGGDDGQPHVRLPREKPTVKLPPAQAAPASAPPMPPHSSVMPPRPTQNWGPPGSGAKPLVMQEAWQARFNGLFNRTPIQTETPPSPPKTPPKVQGPALTVAASSRAVMDEGQVGRGATVSLPRAKKTTSSEGFTIDASPDCVSKRMIEDMFKEELSFGSLPTIRIPGGELYAAKVGSKAPSATPLQPSPAINVTTRSTYDMADLHPRRKDGYVVHLPAFKLFAKAIVRPAGNQRKPSATRHQERKTSGRFRGGKAQDAASTTSTSGPSSRKASAQKSSAPAAGAATAADSTKKASSAARSAAKGRTRAAAPAVAPAAPVKTA